MSRKILNINGLGSTQIWQKRKKKCEGSTQMPKVQATVRVYIKDPGM